MKKVLCCLTIIVCSLFIFFANPQRVTAASPCSTVTIDPTSGPPTTTFILHATGCVQGNGYGFYIRGADGSNLCEEQNFFALTDRTITRNIICAFAANTDYTLTFYSLDLSYIQNISLHINDAASGVQYQCGQQVPDTTPNCSGGQALNCCPSDCPFVNGRLPGQTISTPRCSCGMQGQLACPPSNALGLPTCEAGLVVDANNLCVAAPQEILRYYCGEVIDKDPADPRPAVCIQPDCPLKPYPPGGQWCACGHEGESCCPNPAAPGAPQFQPCNSNTLQCKAGICVQLVAPDNDWQCTTNSSEMGIDTAIGCIPVGKVTSAATFFLRWAIGIGGGLSLLLTLLSGFLIITSSGDPKRLRSGQELLTSAISGLLLIIFTVFILRTIGIKIFGLF